MNANSAILRAYLTVALAVLLVATAGAAFAQSGEDAFRDCAECPEMVKISAPGRTIVGISRGEEERFKVPVTDRQRSEPVTEVYVNYAFVVGRYEITRGQFAAFVRDAHYEFPDANGCWDGFGRLDPRTSVDERRRIGRNSFHATYDWMSPGFSQDDSHPVVCVSIIDMRAYMSWLSSKTGRMYRLLSESEFEYMARAGSRSAWPWGDEANGACLNANVSDLARADADQLDRANDNVFQCYDGFAHTAPVGSFAPNKLGIHDLIGNVWEITANCFTMSLAEMRRDSSSPLNAGCGEFTARGGAWDIFPYATRSGFRSRVDEKSRFSYQGFRVAVTLDR